MNGTTARAGAAGGKPGLTCHGRAAVASGPPPQRRPPRETAPGAQPSLFDTIHGMRQVMATDTFETLSRHYSEREICEPSTDNPPSNG